MEGEQEPLLAEEERGRDANQQHIITSRVTPLPLRQMAVLCFMTFSEPMSAFIIFPFVNEMVVHVGATDDPQKIGYYSGFIESLMEMTAFATSLYWGRLSDRVGRRPVLMIGLVGIIISAIAFGFSETFTAMVISRAINGLLNGNSPVIRSVLAEVTDKTNESLGFSIISLCWCTGAIIAPALGGLLARPADNFPSLFGHIALFRRYPYFLPCLAGASVSILALPTGFFWLKETLDFKSHDQSVVAPGDYGAVDQDGSSHPVAGPVNQAPEDASIHIRDLLQMKKVRDTLISSWIFALISVELHAVWLLWLYTPIQSGGIGLTTFDIGIVFSIVGALDATLLLFIFPPLQRRFGSRAVYLVALWAHFGLVLLFPIVRWIAVWESGSVFANLGDHLSRTLETPHLHVDPELPHTPPGPITMVGIGAMILAKGVSDLAFTAIALLINDSAPSKTTLGAVNGLMSMVSCFMRAVGPVASTSIFAASVSHNLLGGNLFWIVLLVICWLALWSATRLEQTLTIRDLVVENTQE